MTAQALLDLGADPYKQTRFGETTWDLIWEERNASAAMALFDDGVDPARSLFWTKVDEQKDFRHWLEFVAPAECAVVVGDNDRLKAALVKNRGQIPALTHNSLLTESARRGFKELVQTLLEYEAANGPRSEKERASALVYAVRGGHANIVRILIEAKANINTGVRWADTPLSVAASNGDSELIEILLAAGANVEGGAEKDEVTPLMKAAEEGRPRAVALLLRAGAQVNRQSRDGNTALHLAVKTWPLEAALWIIRLLLDAGAGVNTPNKWGDTPLMIAANKAGVPVLKLLLGAGADYRLRDYRGQGWRELAAIRLLERPGGTPASIIEFIDQHEREHGGAKEQA